MLALALILVTAGYSHWFERTWLDVTHLDFTGNVVAPIKIAHISDLHLKAIGSLEHQIVESIGKETPDLILITGDSIDSPDGYQELKKFLPRIAAPLGTWIVRGNWENWVPLKQDKFFYESLGAHLLVNEAQSVRSDVRIIGLDDEISGTIERKLTTAWDEEKAFCILLMHSPIAFDRMFHACPLALAGHTHGGQVNLPFWGPLWLPPGSGEYVAGWYEKRQSKLYVSRGIGTSLLPFRFLARPELSFIHIRNSQ